MFHNRKVAALVPLKDHSERVERKNFRPFCGKPLYHHIISTLDRTYAVDQIIINTDSPAIMGEAIGLSSKVIIHERPAELCGDFVSTNRLFEYDLAHSESDIYIQTHSTNPLLKPETISQGIHKFTEMEADYDSLFSVTRLQTRLYHADGKPVNHDPGELLRTQDLPPIYEENSCLYVFTKESFAARGGRIGHQPFMFEISPIEAVDIDDEFAFRLAELLAMYSREWESS
ncbi:acylneuraminate cytidylyltransferase family protein [Bremerella sp. JC770]|uniref:acylneuraminate cytidylyltransferase family protein n=1 Tax=Bremerella sp. JC770 TaxID=3232137 RepID=UPI003457A2E2